MTMPREPTKRQRQRARGKGHRAQIMESREGLESMMMTMNWKEMGTKC